MKRGSLAPIFYVCSYFGVSSVVSQKFWIQVISHYTREAGSLTGTSLEPGMDFCKIKPKKPESSWYLIWTYQGSCPQNSLFPLKLLFFHGYQCSAYLQKLQVIGDLFPLVGSCFRYKTVAVSSISLSNQFFFLLTCVTMNLVLMRTYIETVYNENLHRTCV